MTATPFWDVDAAAGEIRRCAERATRGCCSPVSPRRSGSPDLGDALGPDLGHRPRVGRRSVPHRLGRHATISTRGGWRPTGGGDLRQRHRHSHPRQRHAGRGPAPRGVLPRLPTSSSCRSSRASGGCRSRWKLSTTRSQGNQVTAQRPELDRLPSACFGVERVRLLLVRRDRPRRLIDKVGADGVLFETDFPHPTCLYGDEVRRRLEGGLGNQDAGVRRKILHISRRCTGSTTRPQPTWSGWSGDPGRGPCRLTAGSRSKMSSSCAGRIRNRTGRGSGP